MNDIETRHSEIDWAGAESDVVSKLGYLRMAWAASERDCSPEVHEKMVVDLYLPILELLSEFCCCITDEIDH